MRTLFILSLVAVSSGAFAESTLEAANLSEAHVMFYMETLHAKKMHEECARRAPEIKEEFSQNYSIWLSNERAIISNTMAVITKFRNESTELEKYGPYVDQFVISKLNSISNFPDPAMARSAISLGCREYFTRLATGKLRTELPKTYKRLDDAARNRR